MQEITGEYYLTNAEIREAKSFCDDFLKLDTYIYEVMRVIKGVPMFIEDHLERLARTAGIQNTMIPFPSEEICRQINLLIKKNVFFEGNIKIVFIPEIESKCDYVFLIYINPHQYPTEDEFVNGVAVSFFRGARIYPNAKLMQTGLRDEANLQKILTKTYEVLLVDEYGYITEGSRSNVFFVRNKEILTPPSEDVLQGITRKYIMELCKENNIPVIEKRISAGETNSFDAVFISGTSRKVLPVCKVENVEYNVENLIVRKVQNEFNVLINNYINSVKDK